MRISDKDRELARELASSFDLTLDPWQERLLALVLWSHRQLPADEPARDRERVLCGALSPTQVFPGAGDQPIRVFCSLMDPADNPPHRMHGGYGPGGAWCTWPAV